MKKTLVHPSLFICLIMTSSRAVLAERRVQNISTRLKSIANRMIILSPCCYDISMNCHYGEFALFADSRLSGPCAIEPVS